MIEYLPFPMSNHTARSLRVVSAVNATALMSSRVIELRCDDMRLQISDFIKEWMVKHTWSSISAIIGETTSTIASVLIRGINWYGKLLLDLVPADTTTSFLVYTTSNMTLTCHSLGTMPVFSFIVCQMAVTLLLNTQSGSRVLTCLIICQFDGFDCWLIGVGIVAK